MKFEPLSLYFEKALVRAIERRSNVGQHTLNVIGVDSPLAIALFLTQATAPDLWSRPHVAIVPTDRDAEDLARCVRFFSPDLPTVTLPAFDVSPYSALYPNPQTSSNRVRWLHLARRERGRRLFIATAESLMQRTIAPARLDSLTKSFRKGDELPSDLARFLSALGYQSTPLVEDVGTFAIRGGIVDVFSPAHALPARLELFGDSIESMRFFSPETQRSESMADGLTLVPPREIVFDDEARARAASRYRNSAASRPVEASERDSVLQSLVHGQIFPGLEFLIGDFEEEFFSPLDHFTSAPFAWSVNPIELERQADALLESLKRDRADAQAHPISPEIASLYLRWDQVPRSSLEREFAFSKIDIQEDAGDESESRDGRLTVKTAPLIFASSATDGPAELQNAVVARVRKLRSEGEFVAIAAATQAQSQRLRALLGHHDLQPRLVSDASFEWTVWRAEQAANADVVHVIPRAVSESLRLPEEGVVILRDEDFFGEKRKRRDRRATGTIEQRANTLAFGDLSPGDAIVHELHGIGIYDGLKKMDIGGVPSEFIQLSYKDGDKLYVPIYRIGQIQKYSGPAGAGLVDKLGGIQWQKTKARVRNHLRELASELLALYAKRAQSRRDPFPANDDDFARFEGAFPYDETDDQLRAIEDILKDLARDTPMDRLVCGDVGFGKTEIAMRAVFKAVQARKQVAVLAPTTVLSFQHQETFLKRFRNWPIVIKALNRFVPPAEARKTIAEAKEGKIDVLIGTHRLLSKDITFKDLGLLVVDEEQKFGVVHKEKMKRMRANIDCLTLSATPIPRTLNMSLVGMRDLSIINTPPVDRLPTRTFVCKYDEETIRKALTSEIARGGQAFYLHNRVQSIYSVADELRRIVPEARLRVGHGQMDEHELEKTMVAFFNHEIDVLVCTTIIESGIDNPRANTMFIDNAHQLGLSQLYQLRGRVGRSKERAYCYLLIPGNRRLEPDAQERLKVIQENTALGSGFRIAHHDLELRGAGNLLGEDQSGQIDAVGYEMYLELLEEAIRSAKGEPIDERVEPDINVRIPALIPESYISDIRIRLSYYKLLSEISSPEDVDRIESDLRDQFGAPPPEAVNLMGLMLVRHHCRELGIRDLSSGQKTLSLAFTEKTPIPPERVVRLAQLQPKKFSLTPDSRLIVRVPEIAWPVIYEELLALRKLT